MKRCRDCNKEAKENRSMCEQCLNKYRQRAKERRNELIKKGKCASCGISDSVADNHLCENCTICRNAARIKRKEKYIKENKCIKCARLKSYVSAWHHSWCPWCQLSYKFEFIGTKESAEKLINDMLAKQNFKCALTGRCLIKNKFHIDHIVPRSLGGTNDISNLQLLVDEANVFKTNLSMNQVIRLAIDIATYHQNPTKTY